MSLTDAVTKKLDAQNQIKDLRETLQREEKRLQAIIDEANAALVMKANDLDIAKIDIAETIIRVSDYSRGGSDRKSCIDDAIKQFATGKAESYYKDLWSVYFGTKNYDRWSGQRHDCQYGYGPRHGSTVFRIETTSAARTRKQSDLTADEVEAVIYYLLNIERIQDARKIAA